MARGSNTIVRWRVTHLVFFFTLRCFGPVGLWWRTCVQQKRHRFGFPATFRRLSSLVRAARIELAPATKQSARKCGTAGEPKLAPNRGTFPQSSLVEAVNHTCSLFSSLSPSHDGGRIALTTDLGTCHASGHTQVTGDRTPSPPSRLASRQWEKERSCAVFFDKKFRSVRKPALLVRKSTFCCIFDIYKYGHSLFVISKGNHYPT